MRLRLPGALGTGARGAIRLLASAASQTEGRGLPAFAAVQSAGAVADTVPVRAGRFAGSVADKFFAGEEEQLPSLYNLIPAEHSSW